MTVQKYFYFTFCSNLIFASTRMFIRNAIRTQDWLCSDWIAETKCFSLSSKFANTVRTASTVSLQLGVIIIIKNTKWWCVDRFLCVDEILYCYCTGETAPRKHSVSQNLKANIKLTTPYDSADGHLKWIALQNPHYPTTHWFFFFCPFTQPSEAKGNCDGGYRIHIKAIESTLSGVWGFLMSSVSQESSVTDWLKACSCCNAGINMCPYWENVSGYG